MARQRLCLQTLVALDLLCLPLCLVSQKSTTTTSNLVENGSFEEGVFNYTGGANLDYISPYPNPNQSFPGWHVTRGNIQRANRRWQPASDCSDKCIDLNGGEAATLITSFRIAMVNHQHTLLFDTTANPEALPSPINGTFTVAVINTAQNSIITSSDIRVTGHHTEYGNTTIGWHTYGLPFTPHVTNVTLSFNSNIQGMFGPLIDNVRIFQGLQLPDTGKDVTCTNQGKKLNIALILGPVISIVLVMLLCIGVSIWRKRKQRNSIDEKAISIMKGKLRVFPYSVVKVATQNFHPDCKLGEGTFGAVYKGILEDGDEVAIKQLFLKTAQGQEEFLNEAMVISAVQHRNLVALKGCCARGQERFLVCEYVENKSLYQVLWGGHVHLDWPKRFQIALGTARGLTYLHESSQPRIIHRDIKAGNILLDSNFEAKIADFGLAKFFADDKTHVSTRIAGTLGYLSPEYATRGQLSEKADVFSFGIVVLELVSGRKNLDHRLPLEDQYILDWARRLWKQGKMKDLIDPEMHADMYMEEIERVIRVGLWCTQEVPTMRPSMSEAIMSMLQGLSGQDENLDLTSSESFNTLHTSESFNTLHIEAPQLPLLLNDSALSIPCSTFTAESSSSTGFSLNELKAHSLERNDMLTT